MKDSIPLDTLLVDDSKRLPKLKATTGGGRGRGRGRGRGGAPTYAFLCHTHCASQLASPNSHLSDRASLIVEVRKVPTGFRTFLNRHVFVEFGSFALRAPAGRGTKFDLPSTWLRCIVHHVHFVLKGRCMSRSSRFMSHAASIP